MASPVSKVIHVVSFLFGLTFVIFAVLSAVLYQNSHFYTFFAVGTWLVLDYIDYRANNYSVMTYFLNERHWDAFLIFFGAATVCCFIVDFVLGVNVTKMWVWRGYLPFDYLIMFLFMNAGFALSMYELFRLIRGLVGKVIKEKHAVKIVIAEKVHRFNAKLALCLGIISFLFPLYPLLTGSNNLIEFAMLFPFVGMIFVTDAITYLTGGQPIMSEVLRLNFSLILSVVITVAIAASLTEAINLFAHEWEYVKMPFMNFKIMSVPVAVFLGWIPLVVSTICIVNMVKHLDFVRDNK